MEIGAVIGAAPRNQVRREVPPVPGDVVVLPCGKTGRDGCGGATGLLKKHSRIPFYMWCRGFKKAMPLRNAKFNALPSW